MNEYLYPSWVFPAQERPVIGGSMIVATIALFVAAMCFGLLLLPEVVALTVLCIMLYRGYDTLASGAVSAGLYLWLKKIYDERFRKKKENQKEKDADFHE